MSDLLREGIPEAVVRSVPQPNRAHENPRRNPKMPDGVFHALTSRKVAALETKTPDPRLRSSRFRIFRTRGALRVPVAAPTITPRRQRYLLPTMQGRRDARLLRSRTRDA